MTPKDSHDRDRVLRDGAHYGAFLDRAIEAVGRPEPTHHNRRTMADLTRDQWAARAAQAVKEREDAAAKLREIAEAKARVERAAQNKRENDEVRQEMRATAWTEAARELRNEQRAREEATQRAEIYSRAFESYVRRGPNRMSSAQREVLDTGRRDLSESESRDLGVATGGVGGYLVPQAFFDRIVAAQKLVGGVRTAAFVYRTATGGTMPVPQDNDTSNVGELLTENTQATILDTTLTSKSLGAYTYSSKLLKVAIQLTQDFAFDIDAWLAHKLGIRLARIENQHFTTGTGSGQPQGVVTGATLGKTGAGGQLTTLIYDDLVDLEHSIDPAYRGGRQLLKGDLGDDNNLGPTTAWMCNDTTLKALEKIKDTSGRPLWQPGLSAGAADSIMGYPVVINQDMASPAASAKSLLFGDFSNYLIREANQLSVLRLTERFADSLQVGFLAFQRVDGALIDAGTAPLKYFQHNAS